MSLIFAVTLGGRIQVGDLLTAAAVVISALSLLAAWRSDRKGRDHERANAVRAAATDTVAKLERWQQLALSYYDSAQPLFVKISDMLTATTAESEAEREKARDALWVGLTEMRSDVLKRILDEDIELAYVGLQTFRPSAYQSVVTVIRQLRKIDKEVYDEFVEDRSQNPVRKPPKPYSAALLGNDLRTAALLSADDLEKRSDEAIEPLRGQLLRLVAEDDQTLLRHPRKLA